MGRIKKMLYDGKVDEASDIYKDMFAIEKAENFHLHIRNLRMLFNKDEFINLCDACDKARSEWNRLGSPIPKPDDPNAPSLTHPEYLYNGSMPIRHGERPTDLMIELQDSPWMPSQPEHIHFHYKSNTILLSKREFVVVAEAFSKALEEFKKHEVVK